MKLWRAGTLLRTVQIDFAPAPDAAPSIGPIHQPGPQTARWVGSELASAMGVDRRLPPAPLTATFDVILDPV